MKIFLSLLFAAALVASPGYALVGAQAGIRSWMDSVAPALLPFIAVIPYLTCDEARMIYNRIFGSAARRLFRLPGRAAAAIIIGWVAGSPAGAMAVAHVAAAEGLTNGEATRLAGLACGVSPVYALSVMGVALTGSAKTGWCFVVSQLTAQLMTGILFRKRFRGMNDRCAAAEIEEKRGSVIGAVLAVLRVGGYMVLFSAGLSISRGMIGEAVMLISPFIDLPVGSEYYARSEMPGWISAAALGFGGLCITFQNLDILSTVGVNSKGYILQKLICGMLCGGVYWLLSARGKAINAAAVRSQPDVFEVNVLFLAAFLIPITAVFVRKLSEKHFS